MQDDYPDPYANGRTKLGNHAVNIFLSFLI